MLFLVESENILSLDGARVGDIVVATCDPDLVGVPEMAKGLTLLELTWQNTDLYSELYSLYKVYVNTSRMTVSMV